VGTSVNDRPPWEKVPVATPDPAIGLWLAALGALVSLAGIVAGLQVGTWIVLWIGLAVAVLGLFLFFLLMLIGRVYRERDRFLGVREQSKLQALAEEEVTAPREKVLVAAPDPAIGLLLAALGALVSVTGIVAGLQIGAWIVLWIGLAVAVLGLFVFFVLMLVGRDYRAERDRVLREAREKAMTPPGAAAMAETITAIWLQRFPGRPMGPRLSAEPDYEVALYSDGTATWRGGGLSEGPGSFTGRLIDERFVFLADLVKRSGFFGWSPDYGRFIDVGWTSVGARFGGSAEVWVVTVGLGGPREFDAIAMAVDEFARGITWTPGRSPRLFWWETPPQEEV
jgi:hypothetical protein